MRFRNLLALFRAGCQQIEDDIDAKLIKETEEEETMTLDEFLQHENIN